MAQVRKMMIQGIRSFSAEDDKGQVIEFFSPMTLIVGANGCGKTTIIEGMKYGFTGLLPPNTKNGGFVNDPKLGSTSETRGMVKIEIFDKKGDRVVVTRRLKGSTVGKIGNVSTTKLEHTLAHYITKPDKSIKKLEMSSKCVDIEEMVRRIVGVSEPILNNVIFCHQEDSCWPLDEPSKVKGKFDAIFNTTMYIKALKTLEDREKGMAGDIKLTKQAFETTHDYLKDARKKIAKLEDQKVALRSMNDEIMEHEKKITELNKKINGLEAISRDYAGKQCLVEKKKGQIAELERSIREIRKKIQEHVDGDLDSLQLKIDQFEFTYKQQCQALKNTKREKAEEEDKRKKLAAKNQKFVVYKGIFDNSKAINEIKLQEMGRIMEDLRGYIRNLKESSQSQGEQFSVSLDSVLMSLDVDVDSVDASTAAKALDSAVTAKVADHKKLKAKLEAEQAKLQAENVELQKSDQAIRTQVEERQSSERQLKKKIDEIRNRLNSLDKSNDKLVELNDKEQNIRETIERLEKSELNKGFESEIKSIQEDIESLDEKKAVLQEQNNLLIKDSQYVVRLKSAQEQKAKKEKECTAIMRNIQPQLQSVVGDDETLPEENLNSFLQGKVDALNKEVDHKNQEVNRIKMDNVKVNTQMNQLNKELESKKKEITQITRKADQFLQGASFVDEYAKIFTEVEDAQSEVSQNEAASFLYKQYVQKLSKKPCCPLCKRDFAKEAENKALIDNLTKMMKKMELARPEQEEKLTELKAKQDQLIKLKPNWEMKEKLEKEVPELQEKKQKYEETLKESKDHLAELTDTLSVLSIDKSTATSLLKDTAIFDRSLSDKKAQDEEIKRWDAARDPKAKELTATVTLSDLQTELQNIESSITARRNEKERKAKLLAQNTAKLTKAKEDLNKVVKESLDIKGDLQNQDGMERQKREYEQESVSLRASIQDLNKQLPKIRSESSRIDREILDFKKSAEEQLGQLVKQKESLVRQKERVGLLDKEIKGFKMECTKFEAESEAQRQVVDDLKGCEEKIKELEDEVDILDNEVRSQEMKKRDLEESKLLKIKEGERDALVAEIETDNKLIEHSKIRGLQTQITEEVTKLRKITAQKDQSIGSRRTVQTLISGLQEELKERKYANAEPNHRANVIKKTVIELAQKDIRIYRLALDAAVMTYHRKKMELINKYMRFYWRKIYRGNDIEYIAIKTDNGDEGQNKTVKLDMSKTQRKSYNYRVVAYRRGIELDMRGRCSAGQKILASIIIRLSLAQTFTTHCGIITLDEPTTNLDKQNVESLANTLCDLALSMRGLNTFQLVVITHDQEFIDSLLRIDPIEYYYKVRRDNMGFSQIERISK